MTTKLTNNNVGMRAKSLFQFNSLKDLSSFKLKIPDVRTSFAAKLGVLILLMIGLITGGSLVYYYNFTKEVVKEQLQGRLLDLARTGAYVLNSQDREIIKQLHSRIVDVIPADYRKRVSALEADDIDTVIAPQDAKAIQASLEYQYIVQLLRQIQSGTRDDVYPIDLLEQSNNTDLIEPKIISAYLMSRIPDVKPVEAVLFIADSDWEDIDENHDGKIVEAEQGNSTGNFYKGEAEVFGKPYSNKKAAVSKDWYVDVWGTTMSAVVPIIAEDGSVIATLGIDYDVTIHEKKMETIFGISISIFVTTIFIGILFTVGLGYLVDKPLSTLSAAAEKLSTQDFDYNIRLRGNDEFSLLGKTFNQVGKDLEAFTQDLESKVAERTKDLQAATDQITELNERLSQENAFLGSEVENVIALRTSALPSSGVKIDNTTVDYQYLPSQSVAGDFIDIIDSQNKVCIVGTVSGNGLETAVLTLLIRQVCRQYLKREEHTPEQILKEVNAQVYEFVEKLELDCTCYLMCIKLQHNGCKLIGQWHEMILKSDNKIESIYQVDAAAPLGISPTYEYSTEDQDVDLSKQSLYLLSPGLSSALAAMYPGKKPHDSFASLLEEKGSISEIIAYLQESLSAEAQVEDITVVKLTHEQ